MQNEKAALYSERKSLNAERTSWASLFRAGRNVTLIAPPWLDRAGALSPA